MKLTYQRLFSDNKIAVFLVSIFSLSLNMKYSYLVVQNETHHNNNNVFFKAEYLIMKEQLKYVCIG